MQMHKQKVIEIMKLAMWCSQIDCNKMPRMSVVVQVLEVTIEVQVYNSVVTVPANHGNAEERDHRLYFVSSDLSGPR